MVYSKDREVYPLKLMSVLEGKMAKKLTFLLAAALAVLVLGIGCGGGEEGEEGEPKEENSTYTVTFIKNNPDMDGPDKVEVKVPAGGSVGDNMPNDKFPVKEDGWNAGYSVSSWRTDPNGNGSLFVARTQVNADITVYAQWGIKESQYVDGTGNLIVIAPMISESSEPTHSVFEGDPPNKDGSITWWNGGIRWAFPQEAAWDKYDYVDIQYLAKVANNLATDILSNDLKQYGDGGYAPIKINDNNNTNLYPSLPLEGTLRYVVRDATGTSPGMAIRINNNSGIVSESYKRTIKFTKATFSQGTRHKITFDLNYDGAPAVTDGFGVQSLTIGTLLLAQKYPQQNKPGGFTFDGWLNKVGDSPVTPATQVTGPLDLKASWVKAVGVSPIEVDFTTANLTPVGAGTIAVPLTGGEKGYTFTYGSGSYRSSWAKFTVNLPDGANLAQYKEVTFEGKAISGDTAYKPFALLAANLLPENFSSDPHSEGGEYRINSKTLDSINLSTTQFQLETFEIDKLKAAALKGAIEICIYDHSAATGNGESTSWQIKNVTFIPADN